MSAFKKGHARRARLTVEMVNVCCPWCGEPQPSPYNGGDLWTREDFEKAGSRAACTSCDQAILIHTDGRAVFL